MAFPRARTASRSLRPPARGYPEIGTAPVERDIAGRAADDMKARQRRGVGRKLAVPDIEDAGAAGTALPLVARDRPEIDSGFLETRIDHAAVMCAVRHRDRTGLLRDRRDAPLGQPLSVGPQGAREKERAGNTRPHAPAHRFDDLVGRCGTVHRHAPLHDPDPEARRHAQHRCKAGGMLHRRDQNLIAALPLDAHQNLRQRIGGVARDRDLVDARTVPFRDTRARLLARLQMYRVGIARNLLQALVIALAHARRHRALLRRHQVDDRGVERELLREGLHHRSRYTSRRLTRRPPHRPWSRRPAVRRTRSAPPQSLGGLAVGSG